MAKKKKNNEAPLKCVECNNQNYWTHKKSTKTNPNPGKVEENKYCKTCRKHTEHKETKVKKG